MCNEIWKPIVTAGNYEVSNLGRVRSLKTDSRHVLKPRLDTAGYFGITLYVSGEKITRRIHRLVAEAFIPNPLNKPCVNHINGIKTDNRAENLEWCTQSENHFHARNTGLSHQGAQNYNAKLTDIDVQYIRDNPDGLTCTQLAKKFGVTKTAISYVQLGKSYKNAGGRIRKAMPRTF